jgi:hypothetical protein
MQVTLFGASFLFKFRSNFRVFCPILRSKSSLIFVYKQSDQRQNSVGSFNQHKILTFLVNNCLCKKISWRLTTFLVNFCLGPKSTWRWAYKVEHECLKNRFFNICLWKQDGKRQFMRKKSLKLFRIHSPVHWWKNGASFLSAQVFWPILYTVPL